MIDSQSLANVENLLAQMRAAARAAQGLDDRPLPGVAQRNGADFAGELKRSLDRVSQIQNDAHNKAQAFSLGDPDVSLNQTMLDLQKANLSFQATLMVRNRLVEAYKEIANMAV